MTQKAVYVRTESGEAVINGEAEIDNPELLIYLLCCDGTMTASEIAQSVRESEEMAESNLLELEATGYAVVRLREVTQADVEGGQANALKQAASNGPLTIDALSKLRQAAKDKTKSKPAEKKPQEAAELAPAFGGDLLRQVKQKAAAEQEPAAALTIGGFKIGFGKKKDAAAQHAVVPAQTLSDEENEELRKKAAELFKKGSQKDIDEMNKDLDFLSKMKPPEANKQSKTGNHEPEKARTSKAARAKAAKKRILRNVSVYGLGFLLASAFAGTGLLLANHKLNASAERCSELISGWIGKQSNTGFCATSLLPSPSVIVTDVEGGKKNIKISIAKFKMSWLSTFFGELKASGADIMGANATSDFFIDLAAIRPEVDQEADFEIENLTLYLGSFPVNNLSAKGYFENSKLTKISISNPDKSFSGSLALSSDAPSFEFNAKPAAIPFLAMVGSEEADFYGKLTPNGLVFDKIEAHLRNGSILRGNGAISWADNAWEAAYEFNASNAFAADILQFFVKDGRADGKIKFKSKADSPEGLWMNGSADAYLTLSNAELDLDFTSLAKGERPFSGSTVRLNESKMKVSGNNGVYVFSIPELKSGPISGAFNVSVNMRTGEISGQAEAGVGAGNKIPARVLFDHGQKRFYLETRPASLTN